MAGNALFESPSRRCRLCLKFYRPWGLLRLSVQGGFDLCHKCYQWHQDALLVLAGKKLPTGCAECNRTWDQIRAVDPRAPGLEHQDRRIYLHGLEGIYVLLCARCSNRIVRLQKKQYRGTAFGAAAKL